MEKDLASGGFNKSFNEPYEVESLILELAEDCITMDRAGLINNVLYRIDVSPKKVDFSDPEHMASMMWNRVFQKVWFRKNFKN